MKKLLFIFSFAFSLGISAQQIILEEFATASNPVEIIASPTNDDRLFVVQQSGTIRILNTNGTFETNNFLNITDRVNFSGEMGLLGLAFHPQFATNRYFYVYYNRAGRTITVSRFTANSANPNTADPATEKVLLSIEKPFTNHNGGSIHFGADGYLWISTGDGGSGGDPNNNGQNKNSLLGKLLRIDVNSENAYNIPADNPFVGIDGADEIWSYGLRNGWKYSFDRTTNTIWIADVGQNAIEEINRVSATTSGVNYGWRCYEGNSAYNTAGCANASTMTFPIVDYDHSGGKCSITGGYVYRGNLYTDIIGKYIFADYCSGQIGILDNTTITWTSAFSGNMFTTFGEDNSKQLYIAASNGKIFKVKTNVLAVSDINKNQIQISPIPAKDVIYINNINDKNITAEILDLSGRSVLNTNVVENDKSIDVSTLRSGNYILVLKKDDIKIISQKIIKE
ncbi:glucose/arabinose dehydrogenase [Epilithonimonas hungarica]|uniref:PQQ-dependent sugar dehydrogenase n=1 Tax=Epilithonimonas hungarica TaxID=454006 RepID=UPI0027887683|nr:PQQ-dependent sugar dehydrogenase [Epilithonimonas hungarica]MDP9954554.1 glucose/arabinose dehydrogenase [Epilithonimonas hungarica]